MAPASLVAAGDTPAREGPVIHGALKLYERHELFVIGPQTLSRQAAVLLGLR